METVLSGRQARPRSPSHFVHTAATCWSLLTATAAATAATALSAGSAWAQRVRVTGVVSNPAGTPLAGVQVRIVGDSGGAVTNQSGRYSVQVPGTGTLRFAYLGYAPQTIAVSGRTAIDVVLQTRAAVLSEVVVATSGYGGDAQRRSQITGAVASVNTAATERQTSASVLQRLDATVSGVAVNANSSPGSRSTVRIRGISSFQNNDPLYIVDGTPLQDSYVNFINPDDIESMQVLKDASAASIYGSRASNGVIIIQTRKGGRSGAPQVRLSARTGLQAPYRGYDNFLLTNSLDYFKVAYQSYANAGYSQADIIAKLGNIYGDPSNPTVPAYIFAADSTRSGVDAFGRPTGVDVSKYSYPGNLIMPGSTGTNWFKAVFGGTAPIHDVNLGVSGAGTGTQYAVSFNYFDQSGTAAYNRFRRGSVRANTQFTRGKFIVGENVAVIGEGSVGGLGGDNYGEGGILGANILAQPVIPIYDVNGNFAAGKANNLGRGTNPLKIAYSGRNNQNTTTRFFGNVFANYDVTPRIAVRTQFGGNVGTQGYQQYNPATPENAEATNQDGFFENDRRFTDYTWSNTARYSNRAGVHNVSVLLGQEYNHSNSRFIQGGINNLLSNDPNSQFISSALGTPVYPYSYGGQSALVSFFGKADYTFDERYTASFTVRRDGSSNLGPNNQYGTFPSGGLSWHASRERFLADSRVISDLQLRVGYGVTGNQSIPSARIVNQFGGGTGTTNYDISGRGVLTPGYQLTALGNANLKWESNKSLNAGFDLGLFANKVTVVADVYNRVTDNLLFSPAIPATAGTAAAPIANVGAMRNRGIDFTVGHQDRNWSLSLNGGHNQNRITRVDGNQGAFFGPTNGVRGGVSPVINQIGKAIGSFYGYQADGYFRDAADVQASPTQDGAAPGRIKFRDINGDGAVTAADRTIIGSPLPKFTGGLDGTVRRGRFDLGATLFGTFGNKVFDAQKNYYVFQDFQTNVRKDLLQNSWRPDNLNAKYPRLDATDTFSKAFSSYYVENGAYVRLRSLQLGFTLPATRARFIPGGSRFYVQAENLFTITGYDGLDPSLPPANITGANGVDLRDQFRGIDQGVYPTSRSFSIGLTTNF